MTEVYVDTSALAKWYVHEVFSLEFERFINAVGQGIIARLAVVEFRCLLARRRRAGSISGAAERAAFRDFERDIKDGYWRIEPVHDAHMIGALGVLDELKSVPLRTLDALHLAVARAVKAKLLATADRTMAEAAVALNMKTENFF